jgi:hypothetical protein
MNNVKTVCSKIGLVPRTLMEVGVAHPHPDSNRLFYFENNGFRVILVEANPRLFYCLKEGWEWGDFKGQWPNVPPPPHKFPGLKHLPNVELHNVAIVDTPGMVKVYERNASTFVGGVMSPARVNDKYIEDPKDAYDIEGVTTDKFDDGTIDVFLSDTEGCEWFCIKHLISRPKVIILETHGNNYINPYIKEINQWMSENNYRLESRDAEDSLFIKKT